MKITIAKNTGFCYGVKRALNIVDGLKCKAAVFGQLIHNKQVLERLKQRGIKIIRKLDDVPVHENIIITAHGIADNVYKRISKLSKKVTDATCPFVKKVHNISKNLEKRGYQVVIIGDPKHVEVKGIAGNLENPIVVDSVEDVKKLGVFEKLGVVSQTTQVQKKFDVIVNELSQHCETFEPHNTICAATRERQSSAEKLAKEVDLMIIIGGYHSANTKRLAQLCSRYVDTKHIETVSDLRKEWIKKKKHVGIVAGASTPDWIIEEVVRALKKHSSVFEQAIEYYQPLINRELKRFLSKELEKLDNEFLRYQYKLIIDNVLAGGKRLRPIALIMAYNSVTGKRSKNIIPVSLSVELLHSSTLVHDDIMDEDDYRRNKKTIHRLVKEYFIENYHEQHYKGPLFSDKSSRFAVTIAVVCGNILKSLGTKCLIGSGDRALSLYQRAYKIVNDGQAMDTFFEIKEKVGEREYFEMIKKKTGNLFKESVLIGAVLGNAKKKQLEYLGKFAELVAVAFQLYDDIMDISPHLSKGHELGSDIKDGKKTLLVIKALELGNAKQKKHVLKCLGNRKVSRKDLDLTIEVLHTTGAVSYVQKIAEKYVSESKKFLKKAKLSKNGEQFFIEFADYLIARKV